MKAQVKRRDVNKMFDQSIRIKLLSHRKIPLIINTLTKESFNVALKKLKDAKCS